MTVAGRAALSILVGTTTAAPARAQDSIVFVLAADSRFEVKTGKSGLFSFAGHEHLIRAHHVTGRIVLFAGDPARSHVEIVVPTDSLEVLTPPDTEEIRKVTAALRTEVLDVADFPEIRFASTVVAPAPGGLHVTGTLTIVGQSREVSADVQTAMGTDTLRATGGFAVKQTAFGIRPYRGGPGNIVRVADQVTFQFEATGVRAGSP